VKRTQHALHRSSNRTLLDVISLDDIAVNDSHVKHSVHVFK